MRCVRRGYEESFEIPPEIIAQDINSPVFTPGAEITLFA